jgi:preprotein translocase subunit SecG
VTRNRLLARLLAPATVLAMLLVLAPAASAANDGRGLYGATDDKVVTNAGFILIVAFPVFVLLMSMLQSRLEKRKQARKAAAKAQVGNPYLGGGW